MGLLKIAPIMLLVNGYWMLSNRMIYANFWAYVEVDGATKEEEVTTNIIDALYKRANS